MKKRKKKYKLNLQKTIHERLSKTILASKINDCITIICEYILENLLNDRAVSIVNFGTFSPKVYGKIRNHYVASGEIKETPHTKLVKFRPHNIFLTMFKNRKNVFKKP